MGAPSTEVCDLLVPHPTKSASTEDRGAIQNLLPGPDLVRRSAIELACAALWPPVEERTLAATAIMDQEAKRSTIPAAGSRDLMNDRSRRRMLRHLDMNPFAIAVDCREEGIQGLES